MRRHPHGGRQSTIQPRSDQLMCYDDDDGDHNSSFAAWYHESIVGHCDQRVAAVISAGVAASKIGGGMPSYGRRSFGRTGVNQTCSSSITIYYRDLAQKALVSFAVRDSGREPPEADFLICVFEECRPTARSRRCHSQTES